MPGPGRGGGSGKPRLLRTNGACERAVCLRYGQLVAELVEGRLLALLTAHYVVSRSHIKQAVRYLGCELVHLCASTLGRSEPSCSVKMNATSYLLDILTAVLPSWRRVASVSFGPSAILGACAPETRGPRHQNVRGGAGHVVGMLRADDFVNDHEQGVRTRRKAPRGTWAARNRPDPGAESRCFSS